MSLITCSNLTYGYGDTALTKPINIRVEQGDYLCIVGENGAGKSTFIKTLLSFIKPMTGSITLGEGLKRNEVGYLPQQTLVQRDFPASVWEIVLSGCQARCGLRPYYNSAEKALAKRNIVKLGLEQLQERCYRDLSGGQQQRVLLARALCATQKLLILDEPVAGLDPKVTQELYNQIAQLNREGITIVMVSHDLQAALQQATHILHIGQNVFFGTVQDYKTSALGKSFLVTEGGDR